MTGWANTEVVSTSSSKAALGKISMSVSLSPKRVDQATKCALIRYSVEAE
jgi:hypothetical protein